MESYVARIPTTEYLEDICPSLIDFQNNSVEIPGQYFQDVEPSPDHHLRIIRFHSELIVQSPQRCFQFRANNGKLYPFCLVTEPNLPCFPQVNKQHTEERVMQLFRVFSCFFDKHKETRRRNVPFKAVSMISLAPFVRIVQRDVQSNSLMQVLQAHCEVSNVDRYHILDQYATSIASGASQQETFIHMSEQIPDTVLTKFILDLMPSPIQLFTFKKQFATDLAVSSTIAYVLGIGGRTPENVSFSRNTGNVVQAAFFPDTAADGQLQFNDVTSIRLTRNITTFLNPIFVDGVVNGLMTATAMCLAHYKEQLRHHIAIFLRDELSTHSEADAESKKKFRTLVDSNTEKVLERIGTLSPTLTLDKSSFTIPINKKITELIANAQHPESLSQLDPIWHPWY